MCIIMSTGVLNNFSFTRKCVSFLYLQRILKLFGDFVKQNVQNHCTFKQLNINHTDVKDYSQNRTTVNCI